jgi:hypothetical protein
MLRSLRARTNEYPQTPHDLESRPVNKQNQEDASNYCYQYDVEDCDELDEDAMREIALRRAASLEALQAYGGCFVSGFLAMQDPLPWLSPATASANFTRSSRSTTSAGSPRPDSDTLSSTGAQESANERKGSWISMKRLRNAGRKSKT